MRAADSEGFETFFALFAAFLRDLSVPSFSLESTDFVASSEMKSKLIRLLARPLQFFGRVDVAEDVC